MDVRSRIIDTASRLFYSQGYNSTGINQVIKEANVAKSSLYQYFPSKDDLLVAYLNEASKNTNQAIDEWLEKYSTASEKVTGLFDFLIVFAESKEFNGCNFLNIISEIPQENERVAALIIKQKNHIRFVFSYILENENHDTTLADELYLLFDASMISSKVYKSSWPAQSAKKVAEKLLNCAK
ncbi:TetR/AcrR family transcriptional regulator [Flectobacillus rivi]|uniref:TetR/AcrR family transcriptional regulator n=1 Tax=Flectobacillus rivi TaxID=2984209 RepID=A0ABT6Z6P0_9BACT|nr:TetR/AcrR family transcriptional regulator [Flectobacillus rivi]MDI9876640.1 TetR/AcrR family transcriptional regulator [Flectobacillus rivi]